jgi:chromosome segregation ATPase
MMSEDIHKWSDGRYVLMFDEHTFFVYDNEKEERMTALEVTKKLNEQQELIEELHISDHMGWGRAEKFEKELKQKKIYIKRLEYKVQKFKEKNDEQQATIRKLQDLCGESDSENAKLRQEIKKLKEEEKLYAQEILRLNTLLKQYQANQDLGGGY